jgi:GxxExxY protein
MFEGDPFTEELIAAAIEVHRGLGPGLLESVYEDCLCHELELRGIPYRRQVPIPLQYKGVKLDCGFRADLLVGDRVVLELKAIDLILPVHLAQVMTYLKLTGYRVGLLFNFNTTILRHGLRRVTV